jgi:hypothetical protein
MMPTELMSAAITVLSNASSKLSNLLDELFSRHLPKVAVHLLLLMPNVRHQPRAKRVGYKRLLGCEARRYCRIATSNSSRGYSGAVGHRGQFPPLSPTVTRPSCRRNCPPRHALTHRSPASEDRPHHPSTYANTSGATMLASDSMMNLGVSTSSFSQVIFSFGTAPE